MQPIPDPSQFIKYGTVGVLLFIVLTILVVGAYAAVKVATALIQKLNNANGSKGNSVLAGQQAIALREAQKQLDELKAGSQPVEFWVRKYDESAEKAMRPVLKKLEEIIESQRRIRVRLKMEDDEQ